MSNYSKLGWHIIGGDRKLGFDDGRSIRIGVRMKWKYRQGMRISICHAGMHASPSARDANDCYTHLKNFYGELRDPAAWLCRVLVENTNRGSRTTETKFVGTHRTVLGMVRLDEVESPHGFLPFAPEKRALALIRKRNRRLGLKTKVR